MKQTLYEFLADFAALMRFFSRVPIPRLGPNDTMDGPPDLAGSGWAIPLVGVLVALPGALILALSPVFGLPGSVAAILAVAAGVIVTGALHEDGLADVADGFGGGRTRERKLDIMKDSRVGSYGVTALVLSLMLRAAAYAALIGRDGAVGTGAAILIAAAAGRAAMLLPWVLLPSARPSGTADALKRPTPQALGIAIALCLATWVLFCATLTIATPGHLMTPFALAGLAAFAMSELARHQIGGFTGDVLGATQQIAELGFLIGTFVP